MTGLARTFFSLEGTATRREWWTVVLLVGVFFVVATLVGAWTGWIWPLFAAMFEQLLVLALFNLVGWLPILAVSVRRLRDRGLSPWWLAAPVVWSVVAPGIISAADLAGALMVGNVLQILGLILSIVIFVQLGVLPSKTAPEAGLTDAAAPEA